MRRCIDCDYKFSCGKANNITICERYKKTPKLITALEEKNGEIYKFKRMENKDE